MCFHLVALPALRKMAGWAQPLLRRISVRTTNDLRLDPERPEYHRCTLQWSRCAMVESVCAEYLCTDMIASPHQLAHHQQPALGQRAAQVLPLYTTVELVGGSSQRVRVSVSASAKAYQHAHHQ